MPIIPCHTVRAGRCSCGKPCDSIAKHPRTEHGLSDGTTDEAMIALHRQKWPDANIAVVTGERSGVDILDIDPDTGGLESLARLIARYGPLAPTWHARTGSGGEHIYLAHYPGMRNSVGRLGPGLDVRGTGGFAVAPPSLHATGRHYEWIVSPGEVPLATWPAWLAALALPPTPRATTPTTGLLVGSQPVPSGLRHYAEAGAPKGERNARAFWLACRLIQECGETPEAWGVFQVFAAACQPPMDTREIERTWDSAKKHQSFAPSAPVLDTARGRLRIVTRKLNRSFRLVSQPQPRRYALVAEAEARHE